MAPGLGDDPLAGVDEQHRSIHRGRSGDHVSGVLLVARCVGHDERASVGGEVPVGNVDGDLLLPFGEQAVKQKGEVEALSLGPEFLGIGLQGCQLVFEDQIGVVQQAPDERALAVIDAAAGKEAQEALVLVHLEIGIDVRGDELRG